VLAYVISQVEIIDPALADRYRPLAAESIAQCGGRPRPRERVRPPLQEGGELVNSIPYDNACAPRLQQP
jgi:hypothetical protein